MALPAKDRFFYISGHEEEGPQALENYKLLKSRTTDK